MRRLGILVACMVTISSFANDMLPIFGSDGTIFTPTGGGTYFGSDGKIYSGTEGGALFGSDGSTVMPGGHVIRPITSEPSYGSSASQPTEHWGGWGSSYGPHYPSYSYSKPIPPKKEIEPTPHGSCYCGLHQGSCMVFKKGAATALSSYRTSQCSVTQCQQAFGSILRNQCGGVWYAYKGYFVKD